METKQTRENLKRTFITGVGGIFTIAEFKKSILKHWAVYVPLISSPIIAILAYCLKVDTLLFILKITDTMIAFLPGILGFTIAGYSLMVGFIQGGILDKISEPWSDSNYSLYQKMSATFALNVILQVIALALAYVVYFVNFIDSSSDISYSLPSNFVKTINEVALLALLFWFLISLSMVVQIVANIFSFSQMHHYFINKYKIEEKEKTTNPSIKDNKSDLC
jgi:hypothetical protein